MASLKRTITSSETYRTLAPLIGRYLRFGMYSPWIRHHVCLVVLTVLAFLSILELLRIIDPYPLRDWMNLRKTLVDLGLVGPVIFVLLTAVLPLFSPMSLLVITARPASARRRASSFPISGPRSTPTSPFSS